MKNFFKAVGVIILMVVLVAVTIIAYLTVDEYRPQEVEKLNVSGSTDIALSKGKTIR